VWMILSTYLDIFDQKETYLTYLSSYLTIFEGIFVFANHISWISDATSVGRVLSWVMLVLAY
jgi:hypothetical protein